MESDFDTLPQKIRSLKIAVDELDCASSSWCNGVRELILSIKPDIDSLYQQHKDIYYIDRLRSQFDQIFKEVNSNVTLNPDRIKFELNCFKGVVKAVAQAVEKETILHFTDESNQIEIFSFFDNDPLYVDGNIKVDIRLPSHHCSQYYKLMNSKEHYDVTFFVDGHSVHAHRIVLAAQSDYFDKLLYGSLIEAQESSKGINIQHVALSSFLLLMSYAYTGYIKLDKAQLQGILTLIEAADRFLFLHLKNALADNLFTFITVANALPIFVTADRLGLKKLYDHCLEFVDSHASEVINEETILHLPESSLVTLLSRDSFLVEELSVYKCIVLWMRHNSVTHCPSLLECVRLTEIPVQELLNYVCPGGNFSETQVLHSLKIQVNKEFQSMKPRGLCRFGVNLFDLDSVCIKGFVNLKPVNNKASPPVSGLAVRNVPQSRQFGGPLPLGVLGRNPQSFHTHAGRVPCCPLSNVILVAPSKVNSIPVSTSSLCFTVSLNGKFLLNHLEFEGNPQENASLVTPLNEIMCTYSIEVSSDGNNWNTLVNYQGYDCHHHQDIWFPKQAISELKFAVSSVLFNTTLKLISCKLDEPILLYKFHKNGFMAPLTYMKPNYKQRYVADFGTWCSSVYLNTPLVLSCIRFNIESTWATGTVADVMVQWTNEHNMQLSKTVENILISSIGSVSQLLDVNLDRNYVVSTLIFTVKNVISPNMFSSGHTPQGSSESHVSNFSFSIKDLEVFAIE